MTSALRWAAKRAILMFQQEVTDKVTGQWPQTTAFLKRKESRSGIEPRSFRLPVSRLTARPNRLTNQRCQVVPLLRTCRPDITVMADCALQSITYLSHTGWIRTYSCSRFACCLKFCRHIIYLSQFIHISHRPLQIHCDVIVL